MSRLDEIEQRLKAATPGPWIFRNISVYESVVHSKIALRQVATLVDPHYNAPRDAALIAHAPADLAYLLRVARVASELLHSDEYTTDPQARRDAIMDNLDAALRDEVAS